MRSDLGLAGRLLGVFLAGGGAFAAWRAGLAANTLLCVVAALWIGADAVLAGRLRRPGAYASSEDRLASAVLSREREMRTLAAYLDHAPVPLLSWSGDALAALNLAARRFFGADGFVPSPPTPLTDAARQAAPGERRVLALAANGGRVRSFALTVSDLAVNGLETRLLALTDIQAEIQAAEAAALRELMQVLSHEIMNSLTPVISLAETSADLTRRAVAEPSVLADAQTVTQAIVRRSEGLLRFVEGYRSLARLPAPELTPVSLQAFVDDVALLFRSRWGTQGVALRVGEAPDVEARMDRDLMTQALLNVLANAAEAALDHASAPEVTFSAERARQGGLQLTISDNGPGLPDGDPAALLRPFVTTKPKGTGVGLSLARQIVLAHGGDLELRSSASGAVVTIGF